MRNGIDWLNDMQESQVKERPLLRRDCPRLPVSTTHRRYQLRHQPTFTRNSTTASDAFPNLDHGLMVYRVKANSFILPKRPTTKRAVPAYFYRC